MLKPLKSMQCPVCKKRRNIVDTQDGQNYNIGYQRNYYLSCGHTVQRRVLAGKRYHSSHG